MDSYEINLKSICRICLERIDKNTSSKQEPEVDPKEVWEKISWCFQITLNFEKGLFYSFCQQCLEDLNTTYFFRRKCLSNNKRFENYCNTLSKLSTVPYSDKDDDTEHFEDSQPELYEERNISSKENVLKNEFICDTCSKVLTTKKSLLKHIVSMHMKHRHPGTVTGFGYSRQYHCTTCSYSTPHSQTLTNHMRRHNGERPFKCECGKSFTQTSSLAAHHKTHSPTTYFTCTECGKQFKHAFSLKTHMKVHSCGTFTCEICNKILKSKRTLTSHLHRHYKIYNFNCEDCGDTFVTSAELHNHKNKHRSKKTIECHVCEYVTHSKKNLIAHIKRHEGEKACKCIFCGKAFITEGNLRRHIRVHSREKPFTCTICTQKFAHSSSLNNHMLTLHGVKFKWGDVKLKESKSKLLKTDCIKIHPAAQNLGQARNLY